jgi:peptidyl-prolyl cis-trans isomerase B (cyclophilin B)
VAGRNERQRRQAREKHRRQLELRAARRQRIRKRLAIGTSGVLAAALIVSLLLVFLPGGGKKHAAASSTAKAKASASASATTSTSAAAVTEPAHHCSYTKSGTAARTVSLPPASPDYTASYTATIKTNLGPITLSLLNSKATCTVNSFVHLAEAGYFDNTQCHRLVTSGIYVLQCGDPYATATTKLTCDMSGKIGTGTPGYEFDSENLTGAKYPAGTLAMANEGSAGTNGSQFFIVYKDSSSGLAASYTPFGTVSSGLNIVQNVAKGGYSCQYTEDGESEGGAPKDKVIIDSVTIKKT